jgi:hypothetical protein
VYLRGANLRGAQLGGALGDGADLSDANLASADLSSTYLSRANLSHADLSGAVLFRAVLSDANLASADLSGADLNGAELTGVELIGACLRNTDLTGVDLRAASLREADLGGANLTNSTVGYTAFGANALNNVKGLESCVHQGPSYIDYHTLAQSGRLPLPFLRGCGLSDEFIDYLPSLFGRAIEYYSCFISHSTMDQEFAYHLHADLQSKGVRCWFAPHDIQGGKKIHEQIDEAIRIHDKLLLILSDHSMNSEWVATEISKARKREVREKRQMLFPVRLVNFETLRDWECFDADTGKDSAREIREYYIPDFSSWKVDHDSYVKEFERLVRDLKADKTEATQAKATAGKGFQ